MHHLPRFSQIGTKTEVHGRSKMALCSCEKSLPELTTRVIVIGIFLGMVMTAANAYLGMKVGMTVSASSAAVMSMLILRGFRFKDVENNAVKQWLQQGKV